MELVNILKALSDETRIRILNLLMVKELCVCELEVLLGLNQSNASRHLNKLSSADILKSYKKGQYVYYFINSDFIKKYQNLYETLRQNFNNYDILMNDKKNLDKYILSGISCEDLKEGKLKF
ncbi:MULTISPECIES: ArsR/SmtB family transcription factor [Caloramator]|jgi:ArsR family transcriptional regulator|uniref:ArsR family transcriptional regulator n=1 Tax=Caloramator proteoclasticus DSM 10124 TaxID=1121262 RepID=A0A1M5AF86_9CLOT|nr:MULTISPECIES: metalloregulator ArsR/SmtB family transcription factor [Caloramator]SHF28776.1 ArsR family transcriptional regulator [Caloramator proteoclasticus DSM 10124]